MIDIVYLLGHGSKYDDFQIRYSIRSVQQYIKFNKIHIVSDRIPNFIDNVNQIYVQDKFKYKGNNIINKVLNVCKSDKVSEDFILMSDDYFITNPINTFPQYYSSCIIPPNISHKYLYIVRNTMLCINSLKQPVRRFDVHSPCIINKQQCMEIFNSIDWANNNYIFKLIYFNLREYNKNMVVKKDNKLKKDVQHDDFNIFKYKYCRDTMFSTRSTIPPNVISYIQQLYTKKSIFQI